MKMYLSIALTMLFCGFARSDLPPAHLCPDRCRARHGCAPGLPLTWSAALGRRSHVMLCAACAALQAMLASGECFLLCARASKQRKKLCLCPYIPQPRHAWDACNLLHCYQLACLQLSQNITFSSDLYMSALRRALSRAPRRAGSAAGGGRRAGHGRHQRLLPWLAPVRALAHPDIFKPSASTSHLLHASSSFAWSLLHCCLLQPVAWQVAVLLILFLQARYQTLASDSDFAPP